MLWVALGACIFAPQARSQVVVYSVDFKHEDGFNIDFFDGGYFVAPALGGSGTFILTSQDKGRKTLSSSAGTGNFFHGLDEHEKRISVVSASGGDGSTSVASYVAFGDVSGTVEIVTTDATYKIKVAKKLKGHAIAASSAENTTSVSSTSASDGSTSTGTSTTTTTTDTTGTGSSSASSSTTISDGTIGFANVSSMSLTFDDGHTKRSNKLDQSVSEASASLVLELQQKGYVDESSSSSSSSSTGTSTSTGTTTTTTTAVPSMSVTVNSASISNGGTADFGSTTSATPVTRDFVISNTGGADLTLSAVVTGTHSSDFVISTAPAATVTGPSGTTTMTIRFTPGATGARTATVTITNNDSTKTSFSVTLNGTGA